MELGMCLFCGINSSVIALVYVSLFLKVSEDVCVLLPALRCAYPPTLINKARKCYLLANVYCQFCCWTIILEPDFKAAWIWVVSELDGKTPHLLPCFI